VKIQTLIYVIGGRVIIINAAIGKGKYYFISIWIVDIRKFLNFYHPHNGNFLMIPKLVLIYL
jgi:hypothetical protein